MSKSKPTREAAKAIVSPFFAWSNAMLKGGELVLDSMAAAARNARTIRVAVLDDAPPRKSRKAKARAGRATRRR
jgi:hypothetical protein